MRHRQLASAKVRDELFGRGTLLGFDWIGDCRLRGIGKWFDQKAPSTV